jgi:hypothetical protein
MQRLVGVALALVASAALPRAGKAQEVDRTPDPGTHAVAIALPDGGGGGFAVRKILDSGANLGITVHFGSAWNWREGGQDDHAFEVGVGPDVRLYRRRSGPVVPFIELGGDVVYRDGPEGAWAGDLGASAALGVEWFALRSMSLSGSTGLRLGIPPRG